jgi:predicted dehydrogenase
MIRIGIVGIGFMGMIHYYSARKLKGAKVTAICTRDRKKRAGDWRSIRGNFGPRGGKEDLAGVKPYASIDEIVADPDVDLLDICLPSDLHRPAAVAGLKAGKHVLVEKSIALSVADADAMVAAAGKARRQLTVAHVLPFFPEFAYARQAIASGEHGKLIGAHFKRVISTPDWSADIASLEKTGGPGIDLHIHDTHFIALACGVPKAVYSRGRMQNGYVEYLTTHYLYDDSGPCVTCSSGAVSQPGREFTHGFEVYFENATLLYEFATLGKKPVSVMPLTLLTADGKVKQPKLKGGDPLGAFTAEIQAAVDGVRTGRQPELLSSALARDALRLCHLEAKSVETGRVVKV